MYQRRPEKFFHYTCPNSLVNVILPHFLQVQFFLHFGKFNTDTRNDAFVYARHNQFTMQFWQMVN